MTLSKLGRLFNTAGKITRDVNAVKRGRVPQRVTNRVIGKAVGSLMRNVWR